MLPQMLFLIFLLSGVNPAYADSTLSTQLGRLLDEARTLDNSIQNALIFIDGPTQELRGKAARDWHSPSDAPVSISSPFRTASIAKTLTAALVLRLEEDGLLAIDDRLDRYLPHHLLTRLHGKQDAYGLTLRQLLNHTSGLADWLEDGERDANGLTPFKQLLIAKPREFWTPTMLLNYVKRQLPPKFAPGQGYHYSDTNYTLLGLVVEKVTGMPLHKAYRHYLWKPLQLNHTYLEWREARIPRGVLPSHSYFGDLDITRYRSLSCDWAGGGLVTTLSDLSRFANALVHDKLFKKPETLQRMMTWGATDNPDSFYGLGLGLIKIGVGPDDVLLGHAGAYGSFMYYYPAKQMVMVGTVNQAVSPQNSTNYILSAVLRWLIKGAPLNTPPA